MVVYSIDCSVYDCFVTRSSPSLCVVRSVVRFCCYGCVVPAVVADRMRRDKAARHHMAAREEKAKQKSISPGELLFQSMFVKIRNLIFLSKPLRSSHFYRGK